MSSHSYHNTTQETGENAARFEEIARTQEDCVLAFFRAHPRADGWTPSEVNRRAMRSCPLTSTRRAITNLTRDGKLVRTNMKRKGPYGRPEYAWRIGSPTQPGLF